MVSFLISQGHTDAFRYPVGHLMAETRLAEQTVNRQLVTEAIVMQHTIASVLSKEGGKAFKKLIERLTDG